MMRGLNGPARNLDEFRGRPLLINVWASWCGPCRAEMASLERLAWLDETHYFTIIGISTDDYIDKAQTALKESNATITHFIDQNFDARAHARRLDSAIDGARRRRWPRARQGPWRAGMG